MLQSKQRILSTDDMFLQGQVLVYLLCIFGFYLFIFNSYFYYLFTYLSTYFIYRQGFPI